MAIIEFRKIPKRIFQFRIDIKGAKPPIWRRVQVKENITFEEFHYIIQNCFEWMNTHLHQFYLDEDSIITDTENEFYEQVYPNEYNETKIKLNDVFKNEGDKLEYEYDFGDSWVHVIKLESILEEKKGQYYPYMLAGRRTAPFEDCGGIWGWEDICRNEDFGYFGKEDIEMKNEIFKDWKEYLEQEKEMKNMY
ncbi:MAG: hypothetical protein PWP46_827 [Fusobacteriaceae bacterium]|jgi:hypothetical protein|nr:hypothetical protein [Fusobacteriaceae bacterium]